MLRAFGGSFDKDKTPEGIVIDEVREEAGYEVDSERVHNLGKMFVSTQMNQYCHIFFVDLTGLTVTERQPENAMEAMGEPTWMTATQVLLNSDWKAIAILSRAAHEGLIFPSDVAPEKV